MLVYIRGIYQSCCTSREVDDFVVARPNGVARPTGVARLPVVFVQLSLQAAPLVIVPLWRFDSGPDLLSPRLWVVRIP